MASKKRPSREVVEALLEVLNREPELAAETARAALYGAETIEPLIRQQVLDEVRERLLAEAAKHRNRTELRVFVTNALSPDPPETQGGGKDV